MLIHQKIGCHLWEDKGSVASANLPKTQWSKKCKTLDQPLNLISRFGRYQSSLEHFPYMMYQREIHDESSKEPQCCIKSELRTASWVRSKWSLVCEDDIDQINALVQKFAFPMSCFPTQYPFCKMDMPQSIHHRIFLWAEELVLSPHFWSWIAGF